MTARLDAVRGTPRWRMAGGESSRTSRRAPARRRYPPVGRGTRFAAAVVYGVRGISTRVLFVTTRSRRSTGADWRGGIVTE